MDFEHIYQIVLKAVQNELKTSKSIVQYYFLLAKSGNDGSYYLRGDNVGNGVPDSGFMRNVAMKTMTEASYYESSDIEQVKYVRVESINGIYHLVLEGSARGFREELDIATKVLKTLI